jgi:hypothetical protein
MAARELKNTKHENNTSGCNRDDSDSKFLSVHALCDTTMKIILFILYFAIGVTMMVCDIFYEVKNPELYFFVGSIAGIILWQSLN